MAQYYSVFTTTGLSKLASAKANGTTLTLTSFALGDGGGVYVAPTENWTSLINEVWSGPVNRTYPSDSDAATYGVECHVPASDGGFTVREFAAKDAAGDTIIVGAFPETVKPTPADGGTRDLYLRALIKHANVASLTISDDPSLVMATQDWVKAYTSESLRVDIAKVGSGMGEPRVYFQGTSTPIAFNTLFFETKPGLWDSVNHKFIVPFGARFAKMSWSLFHSYENESASFDGSPALFISPYINGLSAVEASVSLYELNARSEKITSLKAVNAGDEIDLRAFTSRSSDIPYLKNYPDNQYFQIEFFG